MGSTTVDDQPAWDLSAEYRSLDDGAFTADLEEARRLLGLIEASGADLAERLARVESLDAQADPEGLSLLQETVLRGEAADTLLDNLHTYANCLASVDGGDEAAKAYRGILSDLGARLEAALVPADLILARAPEAYVAAFLARPELSPMAFRLGQARKHRAWLLGQEVEAAVARLRVNGPESWGRLYDAILGSAAVEVESPAGPERLGVSQAQAALKGGDRHRRRAAFQGLGKAFSVHDETLAAILNALAGWRLAEYDLRSRTEAYHFLDAALAQNRLSRASLDALFAAVDGAKALGRRALALQARHLGVERLACHDLLAPCPSTGPGSVYSFAEGLSLVREAYARISPCMGAFVDEMAASRSIEARLLPRKRSGAYCTRFAKSREPKVFQSYAGSLGDVSTLAHELGHAFHGRLLSGLPRPETAYPMNLAETASTFAETALADYLWELPGEGASGRRLEVGWSDAQDAATFLLNIPARFAFEKAFYEARAEKPLGPDALSGLMGDAWHAYYGESLEGRDSGFWKGKLHFYMSGRSFYNFPYTFGYLFSLGVYARRETLGPGFPAAYEALLMDAGRLESEDLARRHLGVDLGAQDFWGESLRIIEGKLDRYEALLDGLD